MMTKWFLSGDQAKDQPRLWKLSAEK